MGGSVRAASWRNLRVDRPEGRRRLRGRVDEDCRPRHGHDGRGRLGHRGPGEPGQHPDGGHLHRRPEQRQAHAGRVLQPRLRQRRGHVGLPHRDAQGGGRRRPRGPRPRRGARRAARHLHRALPDGVRVGQALPPRRQGRGSRARRLRARVRRTRRRRPRPRPRRRRSELEAALRLGRPLRDGGRRGRVVHVDDAEDGGVRGPLHEADDEAQRRRAGSGDGQGGQGGDQGRLDDLGRGRGDDGDGL
mmetsp:Transcript_20021/g.62718  ORF Transcript_20021/g.62718 Transcript_20021/m.62718 type:complete len:246 (-) Transcript_20021:558-1295(-)